MAKKQAATPGNSLYLVLFLSAILIVLSSGCKEKAQAPAPKQINGTCEVFDKLPGDMAKPLELNFANKVKLLGITVDKASPTQLKISDYWQVMEAPGPYYSKVFIIFADKNDKQLFGDNHDFCVGRPAGEIKGKFVKEVYTVGIPTSASGNKISVGIGIFAPEIKTDGGRLKIDSAGKTPVVDNSTRAIVEELNL